MQEKKQATIEMAWKESSKELSQKYPGKVVRNQESVYE